MKAADVPAGHGATGEAGERHIAVHNSGGKLTVLENVCTHMGCQTDWNATDQTWDCPCHGSRYNPDGSVLRGPAMGPLPALGYRVENDEIVIE